MWRSHSDWKPLSEVFTLLNTRWVGVVDNIHVPQHYSLCAHNISAHLGREADRTAPQNLDVVGVGVNRIGTEGSMLYAVILIRNTISCVRSSIFVEKRCKSILRSRLGSFQQVARRVHVKGRSAAACVHFGDVAPVE